MSWMERVSNILRQYTGGGEAQPDAHEQFDEIAAAAPKASLGDGLAEAFRSNETPSFGHMVSHLFSQSTGRAKGGPSYSTVVLWWSGASLANWRCGSPRTGGPPRSRGQGNNTRSGTTCLSRGGTTSS